MTPRPRPDALWANHDRQWRDPQQVIGLWSDAASIDPDLLRSRARGSWWETVERLGVCLVISREYEHLLIGLAVADGKPRISFMPLPHPSGIAFDRPSSVVHVASTRNPNQVFQLRPAAHVLERAELPSNAWRERPLVPVTSQLLPGSLYLHDLALIGGKLHGAAVGHNAIVRIEPDGSWRRVWWPRSIERDGEPDFRRNYLQLNSIAAGKRLSESAFSASSEAPSARRPGHRNYPVDRRGVVFSGRTREPLARGLTRPHSARRYRGALWADDSGYGGLVTIGRDGTSDTVARLPGWTRGLALESGVAFVGTSRVLPRFRGYAPGLEVESSICAVHAVDASSGEVLGSLEWPSGNQIFSIEALPTDFSLGFPTPASGRRPEERLRRLHYSFDLRREGDRG